MTTSTNFGVGNWSLFSSMYLVTMAVRFKAEAPCLFVQREEGVVVVVVVLLKLVRKPEISSCKQ